MKEAAKKATENGDLQTLQSLAQKKCFNISATYERELTLLHIAAREGHLDIVPFLISQGAPIDDKNIEGFSPLMMAIWKGLLNVSQFQRTDLKIPRI